MSTIIVQMSPGSIIVVVSLALITIALFLVGLRSRRKPATARHLDLSAFRTLLDRDDELFLRENLSRFAFSRMKRQRITVTWKYVRRIADNAAVAMRTTIEQRFDSNFDVAGTAAQIADLAAQIRIQCLIAFAKLGAEYLFPSMQLTPAVLVSKYESLRENLSRLGSLQPQDIAPLGSI